jgi:ABC-2 type transport system ATP-binding protein
MEIGLEPFMPNTIEIEGLTKDHSGEKALRGISLSVPPGCLFGIIGADGAGKSTLMNILATLSNSDSGTGKILGLNFKTQYQKIRAEIGFMPQKFSLYQDLSVIENLNFFSDIFGISGSEKTARTAYLLDFAGLQTFTGRRAGNLSGGMKQKLALACTLIHQPKLLLLDEPTVGVDPVARRDFWKMLKSLRSEGIAMVVSTPYMDEAALCDELILLHQGIALAKGKPEKLLSEYLYRLYRIETADTTSTLTYPGDRPPPPGFTLVYPSSGALHAAEPKMSHSDLGALTQSALARMQTVIPRAATATIIEPTLEDYFFALLLGKSSMDLV